VTAVRNLRADSKDKQWFMLDDGEAPEPCGFEVPLGCKAYPIAAVDAAASDTDYCSGSRFGLAAVTVPVGSKRRRRSTQATTAAAITLAEAAYQQRLAPYVLGYVKSSDLDSAE
jgi:hypothetical protein